MIPDDAVPLLGTIPDAVLAKRFGVHEKTVRRWRKQRSIPASRERSLWTPEEDAQLGTDLDTVVAARLGRTKYEVFHRRTRLGIPNWMETMGKKKNPKADESAKDSAFVIVASEESQAFVESLRPIFLAEFAAKGLPIRNIYNWQVVEIALRECLERRKGKEEQ